MNPPTALITGASGAIGAATVRLLDRRGWRVFGTHHDHPERVPTDCTSHRIDFSNPSKATETLRRKLEPDTRRLDLLVHAAGIVCDGVIPRVKPTDWRRIRGIHLDTAFYLSRRLKPFLSEGESPTHVVFFTSRAGIEGSAGQGNYAAAKAGLIGLAVSLAREWAPEVLVNLIRPPLTRSSMTKNLTGPPGSRPGEMTVLEGWSPARLTAEAVGFLSRQTAITGQLIPVDNRIHSPWS